MPGGPEKRFHGFQTSFIYLTTLIRRITRFVDVEYATDVKVVLIGIGWDVSVIQRSRWATGWDAVLRNGGVYFREKEDIERSPDHLKGQHYDVIKWKRFPRYWPFARESTGHQWIPLTKASSAELWCFLRCAPQQMVEKNSGITGGLRLHDIHVTSL